MAGRLKGTKTSHFGTRGRINHDSSEFYSRRLYENLPKEKNVQYVENKIPPENLNRIFNKSSESMQELPDSSVHLVVTSPPYNVGKEYDRNLTLEEYRNFLKKVWCEVRRVLVPGGRVCINVANLGRKPYIPLHAYIIQDMFELGFLMRGEIIWNKAGGGSPSTAWGSWCSPKNPVLRDQHEYILVFSKDKFSRENPYNRRVTLTKKDFLEFTRSVWNFPPESASKVGHPAPFPIELPYRLINLYTYEGEVVLDPFVGSGTTAIAAIMSNRFYVGYEIDEKYIRISEKRIKDFISGFQLELFSD